MARKRQVLNRGKATPVGVGSAMNTSNKASEPQQVGVRILPFPLSTTVAAPAAASAAPPSGAPSAAPSSAASLPSNAPSASPPSAAPSPSNAPSASPGGSLIAPAVVSPSPSPAAHNVAAAAALEKAVRN